MNEKLNAIFQAILEGVNNNREEAFELISFLLRKEDRMGIYSLPDGTRVYYTGEEFVPVYPTL